MSIDSNDAGTSATPDEPDDLDSEQDLVRDIAYALSIVSERPVGRSRRDPRYMVARRVAEHLRLSRWAFRRDRRRSIRVQPG